MTTRPVQLDNVTVDPQFWKGYASAVGPLASRFVTQLMPRFAPTGQLTMPYGHIAKHLGETRLNTVVATQKLEFLNIISVDRSSNVPVFTLNPASDWDDWHAVTF